MSHPFETLASWVADKIGTAWAFAGVIAIYVGWALSGPILHFSDTWQLFINTATTLWTGALIVLLQYAQNRDTRAMHLKLDELLRAVEGARNDLAGIERKPARLKKESK